jgi:hypothetical protein
MLTPAAVVPGLLKEYAASIEQEHQLEAWLEQDPEYLHLQEIRKHIGEIEESIKAAMKENGVDGGIIEAGYMAKLTTRHMKGKVAYNIPAIEKEPWGAGCIVKAINDKVFNAIVDALKLDVTQYATVEPGTTVLAVSITKEEPAKQP